MPTSKQFIGAPVLAGSTFDPVDDAPRKKDKRTLPKKHRNNEDAMNFTIEKFRRFKKFLKKYGGKKFAAGPTKKFQGTPNIEAYRAAEEYFKAYILPAIVQQYELDGFPDYVARAEEWNNYTDSIAREGQVNGIPVTYDDTNEWEAPYWLDRRQFAAGPTKKFAGELYPVVQRKARQVGYEAARAGKAWEPVWDSFYRDWKEDIADIELVKTSLLSGWEDFYDASNPGRGESGEYEFSDRPTKKFGDGPNLYVAFESGRKWAKSIHAGGALQPYPLPGVREAGQRFLPIGGLPKDQETLWLDEFERGAVVGGDEWRRDWGNAYSDVPFSDRPTKKFMDEWLPSNPGWAEGVKAAEAGYSKEEGWALANKNDTDDPTAIAEMAYVYKLAFSRGYDATASMNAQAARGGVSLLAAGPTKKFGAGHGTSYFVSFEKAVDYYQTYEPGTPREQVAALVQAKLDNGSIHIGKPPLKPGDELGIIDNGTRYQIWNEGSGSSGYGHHDYDVPEDYPGRSVQDLMDFADRPTKHFTDGVKARSKFGLVDPEGFMVWGEGDVDEPNAQGEWERTMWFYRITLPYYPTTIYGPFTSRGYASADARASIEEHENRPSIRDMSETPTKHFTDGVKARSKFANILEAEEQYVAHMRKEATPVTEPQVEDFRDGYRNHKKFGLSGVVPSSAKNNVLAALEAIRNWHGSSIEEAVQVFDAAVSAWWNSSENPDFGEYQEVQATKRLLVQKWEHPYVGGLYADRPTRRFGGQA